MKKRIIKMLIVLVLIILLLPFLINEIVKLSVKDRIVSEKEALKFDADAVIVLGCLVRENTPSAMLSDRLDSALSVGVTPLIMSGDHGTKEYDEVNVMRNYAIEKGVPIEKIFMDHAGFCTYDSIYRAKEIFGAKKLIIVTQKYHLYRALYIAKSLGIDAVGIDANKRSYRSQSMREVREILARNKDFLSCLFKIKPKYLGEKIDLKGDGRVTEG